MVSLLAVIEAKKVLEMTAISEINHIFINKIPEETVRELKENPNQTIVRISEVNDEPLDYGNNDFYSMERTVQVQVFYSNVFPISIDAFEVKIMKLFQANDWRVSSSKPHYPDPDTAQSIKVFYFTQIKYV